MEKHSATAYLGDIKLAETDEAIFLEGNYYFPSKDVNTKLFAPSDLETVCPWKGLASYKNIILGDKEIANAVWYYASPSEKASYIQGMVAFDRMKGIKVTAD